MSDTFKQVYNDYISKVQRDFNGFMRTRYSLASNALLNFFDNLKNASEYHLLLIECNKISGRKLSTWELSNFFRRSDGYTLIIENKCDINKGLDLSNQTLEITEFPIMLILQLPYIELSGKEFDIGDWSIKRVGKDFIDSVLNCQTNKIFESIT
jgi:hypothetical protein